MPRRRQMRNPDDDERILRDDEQVVVKRKMRFTDLRKQSRMIEGVSVAIYGGICDYDELLREAVRVALRIDTNPTDDDWDDHYDRIRALTNAYVASPEGQGEDASTLMSRLAVCLADAIPMAVRKRL